VIVAISSVPNSVPDHVISYVSTFSVSTPIVGPGGLPPTSVWPNSPVVVPSGLVPSSVTTAIAI